MADKFMGIGGRGEDGTAKPARFTNNGEQLVQVTGSIVTRSGNGMLAKHIDIQKGSGAWSSVGEIVQSNELDGVPVNYSGMFNRQVYIHNKGVTDLRIDFELKDQAKSINQGAVLVAARERKVLPVNSKKIYTVQDVELFQYLGEGLSVRIHNDDIGTGSADVIFMGGY